MFKADFKYYKSKHPNPELSAIINIKESFTEQKRIIAAFDPKASSTLPRSLGLKSVTEWNICELSTNPGLIFIVNPFTTVGQRYWVSRCLQDYTRKPNRLNLDAHGDVEPDGDWWERCHRNGEVDELLLKKLRWATLGYHHNWDTKVYSEDARDTFPLDLSSLCEFVAKAAGLGGFAAQAAIVNFYHMDSTLSGHTDHSEANREAPLLSFSFGQSAIFLLGGPTVDEKPSAILVESGDVVIMSGPSRLCYHGVPRILPARATPWLGAGPESADGDAATVQTDTPCPGTDVGLLGKCSDESFWSSFGRYLRTSRINVNVRQVLLPGESRILGPSSCVGARHCSCEYSMVKLECTIEKNNSNSM
ncbi:nucleic acid dioxygenase ALKBH1 [Bacillus rossius redtenbacheri]|uniref:nucleic acid dioxygenase ALKBH1 n=1 Tax=Bacillus rossius redtenbacheri TaxID=93214 RepID=UPI002FDD9477